MLVAMAGVHHAVGLDGGIAMKGPSALFIPVGQEPRITQWHDIANKPDQGLLSYNEGLP